MSADLSATRRLIAAVLRGEKPEEALAREAKAEVDVFEVGSVEVGAPEADIAPIAADPVLDTEAIRTLAVLFAVMERWIVTARERSGGKLIVDTETAEAFVLALMVLKRAKFERYAHRKEDPVRFFPIIAKKA